MKPSIGKTAIAKMVAILPCSALANRLAEVRNQVLMDAMDMAVTAGLSLVPLRGTTYKQVVKAC